MQPATRGLELPDPGVAEGLRDGRSPRDGYMRGWGLQFAGVAEQVAADPLYARASSIAGPSLMEESKRMNLFLLLTLYLPALQSRNVVEFGAYRGANAIFMAVVMQEVDPAATVHALDTFKGMPSTDKRIDGHTRDDFADAGLGELTAKRDQLGLTNLKLVQGLFEDTFPNLPGDFGLAHIDCDIYSAVKYAQDAVWDRLAAGGYLVFDDPLTSTCLGAMQAVEELVSERGVRAEQAFPHLVYRKF